MMSTKAWATSYDVVLLCREVSKAWESGATILEFHGLLEDLQKAAETAIENRDNCDEDPRHGEELGRCRESLRKSWEAARPISISPSTGHDM